MYSVNILMLKISYSNFLKPSVSGMITMDGERGTELQRLKPTHELLHFAFLPSQMV